MHGNRSRNIRVEAATSRNDDCLDGLDPWTVPGARPVLAIKGRCPGLPWACIFQLSRCDIWLPAMDLWRKVPQIVFWLHISPLNPPATATQTLDVHFLRPDETARASFAVTWAHVELGISWKHVFTLIYLPVYHKHFSKSIRSAYLRRGKGLGKSYFQITLAVERAKSLLVSIFRTETEVCG